MADTIKSALLVDYDSVFRSLAAAEPAAADRFAARVPAWIAALEAGRLVTANDGSATKRKVLLRRCYSDPAVLGDRRGQFIAAGFQVIDCPAHEGRARNAADIHMVLDTIDALDHPAAYDEFILLSAESDFSPALLRLRTHNRATIIYARAENASAYSAIADGIFEERPLIALLTSSEREAPAEAVVARDGGRAEVPQADRTEIEALARKVHAATNVPLFSPKSFAELFRVLAEEVAKNGYHFQKTAENVAETLVASGRNATRRQVVFVVKGLALKGHVFSNTDTPERLADVFREQVLYLIRNGGLDLSERELAILPTWIVGQASAATSAETADVLGDSDEEAEKPTKAPAMARPTAAKVPPKPIDDQAARAARRKPGKPMTNGKPEAPAAPAAKPPAPPPKPDAAKAPLGQRPAGAIGKPVAATLAKPPAAPAQPAKPASPAPVAAPPPPPRPVASIAPRPAGDKPTLIKPIAEKIAPAADKEAVESTILAAIAQAVDVLVEDSGSQARPEPPKAAPAEPVKPVAAPAPQPPAIDDGDDIGEEIQKIIASYNRDRQQGDK